MKGGASRRFFIKQLVSLSAVISGSGLIFRKGMGDRLGISIAKEAHAIGNPDYATVNTDKTLKIEYVGMSCFLITASNGTKIITDPYKPDNKNIFYPDLRKEPADVVTVSCGHFSHCNVFGIGGAPYVFKRAEPAELKGIRFKGIATRCLAMDENKRQDAGDNFIICFEVDGINICHLGALGHKLTDGQVKQVGKVDILMAPVGGVSALPVPDVTEVCNRLNPRVILPMHYRSERCTFSSWAGVDEFLKDKKNVFRSDSVVGSSEILFRKEMLSADTRIFVPRSAY